MVKMLLRTEPATSLLRGSPTFVNVMVKRAGRWKTRVQIWDDPPNRRDP